MFLFGEYGEMCNECVCLKCKHRSSNNCCELCHLDNFPSPNSYCDNDDVMMGR
jgi:hypothetical protein